MIKIRLQRKGRIRRPIYHIVVADSRSPRDGRIIEQVGRYDGVTEKKETVLNEERIMYWLDTGAQPTDSVRRILRNEGLLYKRHLMMWGKSEEEIEAALAEWRAYRESKAEKEVTRKEQISAVIAAEEKEYKKQVETKAAKAAEELAAEEAKEETPAEEPQAAEESTEEEVVEETASVEQDTTEEVSSEEPEAEASKKEVETQEEPAPAAETETAEEAAPAEEAEEATNESTAEDAPKTSTDMSAQEAIEYINATEKSELEGFVTEAEERKTVLAAWEAKQAE